MVDFTGGTWRSLVDGAEISAIPDSEEYPETTRHRYVPEFVDGLSDGETIEDLDDDIGDANLSGEARYLTDVSGFAAVEINEGSHELNHNLSSDIEQPNAVVAVIDIVEGSNDRFVDTDDFGGRQIIRDLDDPAIRIFAGSDLEVDYPSESPFILTAKFDGSDSILRTNGGETEAIGDVGSNGKGGIQIGTGTDNIDMRALEWAELSDQSDDDLSDVEELMSDAFDIDIAD